MGTADLLDRRIVHCSRLKIRGQQARLLDSSVTDRSQRVTPLFIESPLKAKRIQPGLELPAL
jgi:hypothetical protein